MSIKIKLFISYLILIIFTVSVLGFLIGKRAKDAVFNEVEKKGKSITELVNSTLTIKNGVLIDKAYSDSSFAEMLLKSYGDLSVDNNQSIKVGDFDLPVLYAGKKRLSLDTEFVDKIYKSTGTTATIYLLNDNKLIRVSTNLIESSRDRAVGTYISNDSDIYKKITHNEIYCGRFTFEDEEYSTIAKPLLDKNYKVIGAIALATPIIDHYLIKGLSDIEVGKTGYVSILDSKGNEIINTRTYEQNLSRYDFAKKIISTKNGTVDYTVNGVHKISYYRYFEPWDWYIVTTANYDDLKSSSQSILYTTLFIGLAIALLGGIIALFMANTLVRPINKLKSYIEIAGSGDLTVRSDINSRDEIGMLSNSFNNMISENKRLLEEAVQYDRLKTEFVANMSHELKTPLNIIFSTAQLFSLYIDKENLANSDKLSKYTGTIKQNCYRLLRLVNNLIDITKIDSGFMELNLKNQNIVEVVEEITLSTVEYVQSMSRTIIFDTNREEKIMAFDEEKIERILLNLISNATKFTRPGDVIEVGVYDEGNYVVISVKDTGIGIPDDKITEIFQRFKQVDYLLNRNHEGSGIGLSIVKSLVEMHKGKIDVKSKQGEGTEFIVSLPFRIVSNKVKQESKRDLTNIEKIQIEFSDIYN